MEKVRINYEGIRRVFERTGNLKELDFLVRNYIRLEMPTLKDELDPVLYDVTIQSTTVSNLSDHELCALLINKANPHYALLHRAMMSENRSVLFILFEYDVIDSETFEKIFYQNVTFEDIKHVTIERNHSLYKNFDFSKLRAHFLGLLKDKQHWDDDYLRVSLELLSLTPYDEQSTELLNHILNSIQESPYYKEPQNTAKGQEILIDFIKRQLLPLKGNELLEMLHSKPYFIALINSKPLGIQKESFFYEENGEKKTTYATKIEEIYSLMCKGEIDRIAFAFDFFDELENFRVQILNSWVDNDKVSELDVYANSLIVNEVPIELDERYIASKNQKQPEEKKEI